MQWFAVFFWVFMGSLRSLLRPKRTRRRKRQNPSEGLGLSELFLAVKIFYFWLKNRDLCVLFQFEAL